MSMPSQLMSMSGSFVALNFMIPAACWKALGKLMRHVKLRPEREIDTNALKKLIETAYTDMKERMKVE